MFSVFNSIVEPTLIDSAKDILKPKSTVADPDILQWFKKEYAPKKNVKSLTVISDGRTLTACTLQLTKPAKPPFLKIAIIYLCGNGEYAACSLPALEQLAIDITHEGHKANANTEYTLFCQDYRGKGFNQQNSQENFNDYSLYQDAKDQAALIKTLLEHDFFPENIFIIGHSLGSAIALWSVDILINDFKLDGKKIKIFSDRGYGNLLDFPFVRPFLSDQNKTNGKLRENGMMPSLSLHNIAMRLPNCFIFRVENDGVIQASISLANTFKPTEIPGRIWSGEMNAEQKNNPHNAPFHAIQMSDVPELKPHHFMTSIIHQLPIRLIFEKTSSTTDSKLSTEINHIALPVTNTLIDTLNKYLEDRTAELAMTHFGSSYTKGLFSLISWTTEDQIKCAHQLIDALCHENGPNIEVIHKMKLTNGPHKTGELNVIFEKMLKLISQLEQLQHFNHWIISMPAQRKTTELSKTENDYFKFFKPSVVGFGAIVGGLATYGLGGIAIGAFAGYAASDAAETMREHCKKNLGSDYRP